MLVSGIMLVFAVQSSLNALVVSGCIPPTGLPLPLISAGNTSLVVTMAGMGVVYGVSRQTAAREQGAVFSGIPRKKRRAVKLNKKS